MKKSFIYVLAAGICLCMSGCGSETKKQNSNTEVSTTELADNENNFDETNEQDSDGGRIKTNKSPNSLYRQVTSAETRMMNADDDLADAKYIVIEIEKSNDEMILGESNAVIDLDSKAYYINCDYNDYTSCEKKVDSDEDSLNSIIAQIKKMDLPDWDNNIQYTKQSNEYWWDMHIIMSDGDVIRYTGNYPGENEQENQMDSIIKSLGL